MLAPDGPRVIEIDARLPSQTPTAVLHASGVNMVALLVEAASSGHLPESTSGVEAGVVYQHVLGERGRLQVLGEHIIASAGPLRLEPGFFGSLEALTDYQPGAARWVATLISREPKLGEAREAAREVLARLARHTDLELAPESEPAGAELAA
jgi:pyrrolysine biosynthesis protein PylC